MLFHLESLRHTVNVTSKPIGLIPQRVNGQTFDLSRAGLEFGLECQAALTVVGDVWDLEAAGAVGLIGFEVDPELAGARGEGDGPLVGLAGLVGGDGAWRRCGRRRWRLPNREQKLETITSGTGLPWRAPKPTLSP